MGTWHACHKCSEDGVIGAQPLPRRCGAPSGHMNVSSSHVPVPVPAVDNRLDERKNQNCALSHNPLPLVSQRGVGLQDLRLPPPPWHPLALHDFHAALISPWSLQRVPVISYTFTC